MRQESMSSRESAKRTVRDIRRKTRKQYSAEEKIRIVVSGLRGEDSIAELCRRVGIAATFFVTVEGGGMAEHGILAGDTLIVDRSRTPGTGSIVIG